MDTYLAYARRGLNSWWRWLLTPVAAFVLWMLLVAVISFVAARARLMPADPTAEFTTPLHPVIFFTGYGLAFGALVAALVIAMRLLQRKRFVDVVGLWRWRQFWLGLAVWGACLTVLSIGDFLLRPGDFRWIASPATAQLAVVALLGLGVQTFAEEFIFRGYVTQGLLLATKRPLVASVLSGLLFGALHIANGIPQALNAVLFGAVASLITIRTGGLAFTYGMHLINNLAGAVIVVSANDVLRGSPGLITQSSPNLLWWDLTFGIAMLAIPAWIVLRPRGDRRPAPG